MKCQNLFSSKNKKNILKCCLLNFLPSMLSVKNVIFVVVGLELILLVLVRIASLK